MSDADDVGWDDKNRIEIAGFYRLKGSVNLAYSWSPAQCMKGCRLRRCALASLMIGRST